MQASTTSFAQALLQNKTFIQFVKHVLSGFVAAFFDFSVLWLLAYPLHIAYPIAVAGGFAAGTIVVYIMGALWVFKRGSMSIWQEFLAVALLNVVALGLAEAVIYGFVEFAHLNLMVSKCISVVIVTFFNFVMRRSFIFK